MERRCSLNRASERMAGRRSQVRLGARALSALVIAACGNAPRPPASPEVQRPPLRPAAAAAQPGRTETARPSCPRLPRAARTWTGFAVDVPSGAMHLALDALVPIQEALGSLFCGPERAPCRPAALLSVDLADASASAAQVQLDVGAAEPRSLLLRSENGSWQAEPASLAAFLAACGAGGVR